MSQKIPYTVIVPVAIIFGLFVLGSRFWVSVPAGHVAVGTLFGAVQDDAYGEGLNIPVNPLLKFHQFDIREKTHKEQAQVPSQDQLQTQIDVSVQYRLNGSIPFERFNGFKYLKGNWLNRKHD